MKRTVLFLMATVLVFAVVPTRALAQSEAESLRKQVELLEEQLQAVKDRLKALERKSASQEQKIAETDRQAREAERADTKWHLAGYANAGYTASDSGDSPDSFGMVQFNPMFHFQYRDRILFEAELELVTNSDGSTETEIEYSQVDFFVNDNLTLVMGKYLSPIGQFQERLHPSWINKLPNAPAGFAHGEALPLTDVGVQARGGFFTDPGIFTYAVFAGNGPQPGHDALELEGFGGDNNDDKAFGARFAFLPSPDLEFGVSAMTVGEVEPEGFHVPGDAGYDLYGFDFAYTQGAWDIRGEFIDSELDSLREEEEHGHDVFKNGGAERAGDELTEIVGTDWQAWYLQVARKFGQWEPVLRYGEYEVRRAEEDHADEASVFFLKSEEPGGHEAFAGKEKRITLGLNYLFSPAVIAKMAYEDRDFSDNHLPDEERIMFQIAYGF